MNNEVSPVNNTIIEALQNNQVIAYPTEAVFGVGCDPDSESAVMALLELKQRAIEKGLILIADNYEQLKPYIDDNALTQEQRVRMFASWPGPITWVIPAKSTTPKWLTGRFSSLAVRVTDHPIVKALCVAYGKPLVSTSANLSGLPPCRNVEEVQEQFRNRIAIVNGEVGGRKNPSEIRDALTGELYRQG